MKPLRLLALLLAATAWCTSAAFACDGAKSSAANASSCSAKSATAAAAHAGCAAKGATTATVASATPDCCAKGKTTAAVAAASPKSGGAAPSCGMSAEQCKAMQASGACNAQMKSACAAKGNRTASASASAGACVGHSAVHANCAVCSDEMECDDDVRATGAHAQIVSLRNGAMIVYTLEGTENVRALQAAVARHNQGVVAALQGDAKLCGDCKKLRGALASGKLTREVINVERGCQLLITSSDRAIVQQVQACANAQVAARTSTKL